MAEIIQHMNADHKDALGMRARVFAGIQSQEATMTTVDRLGLHLRMKPRVACGAHASHVGWEVSSAAEARKSNGI